MTNENIRNIANQFDVGGLNKGNYKYVKKLPDNRDQGLKVRDITK